MKAVMLPLWVVVLLAVGCVTHRTQVAGVRQWNYWAQQSGELGAAMAAEAAEMCIDLGALSRSAQGAIVPGDVDPAAPECKVEPALAAENAKGMAYEREQRNLILDTAKGFLVEAVKQLPWGGPSLVLLGTLWGFYRKLKAKNIDIAKGKEALDAGVVLFQRAKEKLADGRLTLDEFKELFVQANSAGPQFLAGAAQIKTTYDELKSAWTADGTPIRSA